MDEREFTSLDLFYMLKEIKRIEGAFVNKVYQKGDKLYLMLRKSENLMLVVGPNRFHLTEYKPEFPTKPPNFSMLLRKHLVGTKIEKLEQLDFDRVLILHFTYGKKLVIELFGKGNILLLNENNVIIQPLRFQEWKARSLKPKKEYVPPPKGENPLEINKLDFSMSLQSSKKDVVRTLALNFGLGGVYAEEICAMANVDKNTLCSKIFTGDIPLIYKNMQKLFNKKISPRVYLKDEKPVGYAPFKLETITEAEKKTKTFSKACDEYYTFIDKRAIKKRTEEREKKIQQRKEMQEKHLEELKQEQIRLKKEADKLAAEHKFEEASKKYNKIKKNKTKIPGLNSAIARTQKNIEKEKAKPKPKLKKKEKPKEWYDKFKWFRTSTGALVVCGKDATTNELLIKKHTKPEEIVFHAEITGAPFCVIKDTTKPGKSDLAETAVFSASHSKAWQKGYGTIDVYWVKGKQLDKEAPAGESIGKGAFMVHGKKNYFKNTPLKIAIGIDNNFNVIAGPEESIKKRTIAYSIVTPGPIKSKKLAQQIKQVWMNKLSKKQIEKTKQINIQEIQKHIPAGKGSLL